MATTKIILDPNAELIVERGEVRVHFTAAGQITVQGNMPVSIGGLLPETDDRGAQTDWII